MERLHYILLTPFVLTLLISPHKTFAEEDKCEGLYPVFSPSSLVVRYGDPVSVTCSAPKTTKNSTQYSGMGFEAKQGSADGLQDNVTTRTWNVSSLTEWEEAQGIQCYSYFEEHDQCITNLSVTIYKPPDSVSLRFVNESGPMVEGNQYQLECEVQNVAPVQNLTVKWFRGKTLLHESTVSQFSVTGHIHKNVTVTDRYTITASREDHGLQYKCEAELKLGLPESLKYPSEPLNMTVLYGPVLTCPNRIRVREIFNCTVVGYPIPVVSWFNASQSMENPGSQLTSVGNYTVRAESTLGNSNHAIEVVDFSECVGDIFNCTVEETDDDDHLMILAAAAAIAVLVLMVALGVMFCVHYRKTRMGHYIMKNILPNRINRHITHIKESEQSQL